jgi:hypothetical protein
VPRIELPLETRCRLSAEELIVVLEQIDGEEASISVGANTEADSTLDGDGAGEPGTIVSFGGTLAFCEDRSELWVTDQEPVGEPVVKKEPGRAGKRNAKKLAAQRKAKIGGTVYLRLEALRFAVLWTFDGNDYFQLTLHYRDSVVDISGFS